MKGKKQMIDYDNLKRQLEVIDNAPCGDRFDLILALPIPDVLKSDLATHWWDVYSEANAEAYRTMQMMLLDHEYPVVKNVKFSGIRSHMAILANDIRVYGDGSSGTYSMVNWGDDRRAGRYVQPHFTSFGMIMETAPALRPDGEPILTCKRENGIAAEPAWWAQYVRYLNKEKWFEATSKQVMFSKVDGFGPAPLWAGHDPDEQDFEYFSREPKANGTFSHNLMRCALHIRWDGAPSITHNVSNHKGLNHVHEVDGLGYRPIDFTIRQESDNAGGKVYTWLIDGEIRQQIESAKLEKLHGRTMKNAVARTNPTLDISTNIGSALIETGWGRPNPVLAGAFMGVGEFEVRKAGVVKKTL